MCVNLKYDTENLQVDTGNMVGLRTTELIISLYPIIVPASMI